MLRHRWTAFALLLLGFLVAFPAPFPVCAEADGTATVRQEDAWKGEFEEVCARTSASMTMTREELRAMLERCDRLRPAVDALPESPRKVFGKRLEMTRNLYQFVLETKEQDKPAGQ